MSTEVAIPETAIIHSESGVADVLAVISRAAADPNVDVSKMQALLQMRREVMAENAKIAFNEAMARVQTRLPRITKHGRILNKDGTVRSRYAPMEDIDAEVRPLLSEEGLSVSYTTAWHENMLTVTCTVKHVMGHEMSSPLAVPFDKNQYRTGAQDMGSTNTYAKRYALCNALNIITVDDNDGQKEPDEPITLEQLNQLRDMLIHTNANEKKFCEYMDVETIEQITQDRFAMALNALKAKARKG